MQKRMGQGPVNKKLGRRGQGGVGRAGGQGLSAGRAGQARPANAGAKITQRLGRQAQRPKPNQGGGRLTKRP